MVWLVWIYFLCAQAMIDNWPQHKLNVAEITQHSSPMFSKEDSPYGSMDSTITYLVNVTVGDDTHATLSIILCHASQLKFFLKQETGLPRCEGGRLNIPMLASPSKYSIEGGNTSKFYNHTFNVTDTGVYYLMFVSCDYNSTTESILISGSCAWRNPYGYLPGSSFMLLPISGAFAVFYLLLLLIYTIFSIIHRQILMKVQYVILFVILMSVCEAVSWFFIRLSNNDLGVYSAPTIFVVVLFAAIRQTSLHLLTLLVAMGIGTVKWTLGTTRTKLGLLTVFYLFFSFVLLFVTELNRVKKTVIVPTHIFKLLIAVPFALLSVAFYYWIGLSLIRTLQQLTLRRQTLKHQVYKLFFSVLSITTVFAISGGLYSLIINNQVKSVDDPSWQKAWWGECFIETMFLFVTLSLALLWRPSTNNQLYGYAEYFADSGNEGPSKDDTSVQLETLTIVGGGELSQRRKGSGHEEKQEVAVENVAAGIVLTEFDKDILAFDLSDDSDEASVQTQISKLD